VANNENNMLVSENITQFVPQAGGQISLQEANQLKTLIFSIPWGHIKLVIGKIKDINTALYYFRQTIDNGWSRDTLALQIKTNLHLRQGQAVTNFNDTLPQPLSELAQQTLKDPYIFDFMTMAKPFHEKDIEDQLISHITKFMLELGKGFAFVGRQYHLEIADYDYFIDLLFYHIQLKCYVVIELKNTKFIPEYAGKLNFYLSAVDTILKREDDNQTLGILLCRDKNNREAEFALRDIKKPMGVSEFSLIESLPDNLRSCLPTIEEIENELNNQK
jgi:predicted nuclease of restriction endonuclease-like (RecB) superfamily